MGIESKAELEIDKSIYSDFYRDVETENVNSVKELTSFIKNTTYDLMHLFVDVDEQGNVYDSEGDKIKLYKLIDLIQNNNVTYILFARDTPFEHYKAGLGKYKKTANIILTTERKGNFFPDFFRKIFARSSKGESFFAVWVDYAPQGPKPTKEHDTVPGTIALMSGRIINLKSDIE